MSEQGRPNLWKRINVAPPTQGDSPEVWEYVPVEPDYEAMGEAIPEWVIDRLGPEFVPTSLAKLMWRAGIGGSDG